MLRKFSFILVYFITASFLSSCGTSVTRTASDTTTDLSGNWNDTDSRLVSEEMVRDLLSRPWLANYELENRQRPVLVVGSVQNLSHEHIATDTFINDIERELINSGRVDFVSGVAFRDQLRSERAEQDIFASPETRKSMGQEIGADLMLLGQINTILDTEGRNQVKFYQTDLRLIDIETNRIFWTGQKQIKKEVSRGLFR